MLFGKPLRNACTEGGGNNKSKCLQNIHCISLDKSQEWLLFFLHHFWQVDSLRDDYTGETNVVV